MLNNSTYYQDKSHISHSMLCDFVSYDKYGNRLITPEFYYAKYIAESIQNQEPSDAMTVGTIVDRYVSEGGHILDEYPVVSKRSGTNPKEITKSMNESVTAMITSVQSFKTLQDFISLPDTVKGSDDGSILVNSISFEHGEMKLRGKVDFINHTTKQIVDLKTTASVDRVWDDLQFKSSPNIFARYIRQGAYYNYLAGGGYEFALAIVDENGKILFVPVRPNILEAAWNNIYTDLNELSKYYSSNWSVLTNDPFGELKSIEDINII